MLVRFFCVLVLFTSPITFSAETANHGVAIDIESIGRPPIDLFSVGDGLPDLTAVSVSASPDGHVWVGTMRGLTRFNGLRFVTSELPAPGSSKMITAVLALGKNEVWAARANDGVFSWNGQQWRHYDSGKDFPGTNVRRFRVFNSPQGRRLFASTDSGVVAEFDGNKWLARKLPAELINQQIFDILLLPAKNTDEEILYLATYGAGLYQCLGKLACTAVPILGEPRFFEISSLRSVVEADGTSTLWAGSYAGGVARLQKGVWTRYTQESGALTGNYVHDLEVIPFADGNNEVWVGTRNGVSRFRNGQWSRYDNKDPLNNRRVRSLAIAHNAQGQPQLWAGTDDGVARLHLRGDLRTVSRISNNANGVWAVKFEHDPNGQERLWLGSDGDGLQLFENGSWKKYGLESGLPALIVRSLARSPGGPLWVGLWNGQIALQEGNKFHELTTPWPKEEREAISTMYAMKNGNVWVGLRKNGLAFYDGKQWRWFESGKGKAPERIMSIINTGTEENPVLWITSFTGGLTRFSAGQWKTFTTANSEIPDNELAIANLYPNKQGKSVLWIGTRYHGLIRIDISDADKPRWVTEPQLPEPPHLFVYGAIQNDRGDLVLCSDYGAAYWRLEKNGKYRAIDYHRANGMPHDECNSGALSFDSHGRAWLGTIGGAAVHANINTDEMKPAQLYVERVRVNSIEMSASAAKSIALENADSKIDLEFALLTGQRESESLYRMQLIGLEEKPGEWQQSNQRSLGNLPPGNYRFKVEAKNFAGIEASPIEIAISVPQPWWRSVLGLFIIVGLGATLLLLFIRWRERSLRLRAKKLLRLVSERTSELELRGVELRDMNDELTRLSYFDPLTDLANRRRLLERLHTAWGDAHRKGESLAFILLDVDDFKAINDHYGHLIGDDYLRRIARIIEAALSNSDYTAGRYGGEEFGIVVTNSDSGKAAVIAEQICRLVASEKIPHVGSSRGIVTVSLGVAAIRPHAGANAELVIAAADDALYVAKQNGKNRVEISGK
ncbi:MAG: diguanylate cyclase [Arenimonas sp.]